MANVKILFILQTRKNRIELAKTQHFNNEVKTTTAMLIAHELTHQWIGNLVTPAWWNDLWLSESLAKYFEYKIINQVIINFNNFTFVLLSFTFII